MGRNPGLDTLLELHGECFQMENGYWTKIEAWKVEPTKERPHGIRYCLTLHNRYNKRVFGYDNAHAPPSKGKRHGPHRGRIVAYDHMHQTSTDTGTPYSFVDAQQLLEDFFNAVNRIVDGE